ncbi:MAG: hypothetical protein Q9159_006333 [Coniocarpon cinnabarinum]
MTAERTSHFRDIGTLISTCGCDEIASATGAILIKMQGRIDDLSSQLVKRYINILVLARVPKKHVDENDTSADTFVRSQSGTTDRDRAALNSLKMDVETQGLIRATENLLMLTRQMKELWLFGQLDTLGKSDTVEQTERDALAVAKMVDDLRKQGRLFGGPGNGDSRVADGDS